VFNKGKHLFAYDRAKETMAATGEAIVCEGYTDVIAMHENGFTNAVAALGTAFRLDHIKLMERQRVNRIVCLFDGDAAGQRAAERAVQFIDKTPAELRCVVLPDNQDPMEFLAAHPASELRPILDAARPLMDFVFDKRLEGVQTGVPGQRVAALESMARVLAPLKKSVLMPEYAARLADLLSMDAEDVKRAIREAPLPKDQDGAAQGRRAASASRPSGGAARTAPAPVGRGFSSWDDGADEVPADAYGYVPDEAYADGYYDAPPALAPGRAGIAAPEARGVSEDERRQLVSERELLCALAARPDEVKALGGRLADIQWADSRHEAMAWAMLSTPDGAAPAEVVAAAAAMEPSAPQVLSGGRVMGEEGMGDAEKLGLIVDTLEFFSCRRRIRRIRGRLRQGSGIPDEQARELFAEATSLQARANELRNRLSSSSMVPHL